MLKIEFTGYSAGSKVQEQNGVFAPPAHEDFPWKRRFRFILWDYSLVLSKITRPSKSVVRRRVALSGRRVFTTPTPILCSHFTDPVFESRANTRPFFVP